MKLKNKLFQFVLMLVFLINILTSSPASANITVNNATTSGFTSANISLNGSRWTDSGQLAINLNASYLNGLVGYWSMDETTGTIIHNVNTESGLVNTTNQGTWNGNTTLNYTTGRIGNAGNFDGVNDYVNAGNGASLNITGDLTISAWIYPVGWGQAGYGRIVSKTSGSSGYEFVIENAKLDFNAIGAVDSEASGATSSLSLNILQHAVVSINAGSVNFYVNGILKNGGDTTVSASFIGGTANLNIGQRPDLNARNFNGRIDEVSIYNRALTDLEISELYNRSMRVQAMPVISNQSASAGNLINRIRITYSGQDAVNNISIYARQNGTTNYDVIQSNATSGTWYNITNKYKIMDFGIQMNGNGSNTPFFESLEFDETPPNLTITSLTNVTGNFFVNHSWIDGMATSYNVNINGTWYNGTTNTYNYTVSYPHGWVNISVAGVFDGIVGNFSSQNTQVPNNIPSCSNLISPRTVITDSYLNFTMVCTDLDGDNLTFSTNATLGALNSSGFYTYKALDSDKGTYYFLFSAGDISGYSNQTIVVTVVSTLDVINSRFDTLDDEVRSAGEMGFMGGIAGGIVAVAAINRCCRRRKDGGEKKD